MTTLKKFTERLERQADDGHHWDRAPQMLRDAAAHIRRLEAGLRLVVSLTTPCECVPCTRIRTEALNVLEPNAGLTSETKGE